MANEKPAAPPPAAPTEEKDAPRKKGGMKMALVAGIVVVLEILTVITTMSLNRGPKTTLAGNLTTTLPVVVERDVEVKLIDVKMPNSLSGKLYMYDLGVVAKVGEKNKEKVTALFTEREAEIRDKVRAIIASSDPPSLAEPGLETIRRKISYQLEQDIGKDLIKEVLIPKCTPYRTE